MSGAQSLMQGFAALGQGAVQEARVRVEQNVDAESTASGDSFHELLSELSGGAGVPAEGPVDSGVAAGVLPDTASRVALLDSVMTEAEPLLGESSQPGVPGGASKYVEPVQAALYGAGMAVPLIVSPIPLAADGDDPSNTTAPVGAPLSADVPRRQASSTNLRSMLSSQEQTGGAGVPMPRLPPVSDFPSDGVSVREASNNLGFAFQDVPLELAPLQATTGARLARVQTDGDFLSVQVSVQGQESHFAPVTTISRVLAPFASGLVPVTRPQDESQTAPRLEIAESDARPTGTVTTVEAQETTDPAVIRPAFHANGVPGGTLRSARGSADRELSDFPSDGSATKNEGVLSSGDVLAVAQRSMEALPAGGTAAVSQIAQRIVAQFAESEAPPHFAAGRVESVPVPGPAGGVLKVLHLQLEPADLGRVTVRVSLKGSVISLHLESSHQETARAVERDRETLSNLLKSAGYLVDGITSQPSEVLRASAQVQPAVSADAQSAQSTSAQSQSGMSQSRGQSGDQPPRYPHDDGHPSGGGVNEGRGDASQRARGALYV